MTELLNMPTLLPVDRLTDRLRRVIELHFDPAGGSAYWLDRARELGIDPRHEIRRTDELSLLGEMTPADLTRRPLLDYIPRALQGTLSRFVVAQTGGTTGNGAWTAYRHDEFLQAFVAPFVSAASAVGFPGDEQWLFVGPTGPHVIGKAVRHLAAAFGSAEPFAVDFDPRWARKLPEGSFARARYLAHVTDQSIAVIAAQDVGVLFTTPPVLLALAERMTESQRQRIRAVHYGGVAITPEQMLEFQVELFPRALHLSGYGNTLFGCCMELSSEPGRQIDYFPHGDRLILEVVGESGSPAPLNRMGRVRVTRLDESMLIVRMLERDVAEPQPCPAHAAPGFHLSGVRNPHTPSALVAAAGSGLY